MEGIQQSETVNHLSFDFDDLTGASNAGQKTNATATASEGNDSITPTTTTKSSSSSGAEAVTSGSGGKDSSKVENSPLKEGAEVKKASEVKEGRSEPFRGDDGTEEEKTEDGARIIYKYDGPFSNVPNFAAETRRIQQLQQENSEQFEHVMSIGREFILACGSGKEDVDELKQKWVPLYESNTLSFWHVMKAFEGACFGARIATMEFFIKNGLDLKADIFNGFLHKFIVENAGVTFKFENTIRFLLQNGMDVDQFEPQKYQTPMHRACITKNLSMIKLLVEFKGDVNAIDSDGKMPLNYLEGIESDDRILVEFLQSKGGKETWRNELPKDCDWQRDVEQFS